MLSSLCFYVLKAYMMFLSVSVLDVSHVTTFPFPSPMWTSKTYAECYLSFVIIVSHCSRELRLSRKSWDSLSSNVSLNGNCCIFITLNYFGNVICVFNWKEFICVFTPFISFLSTVTVLPCSGNLELSAKCFQELILKDQNHPVALVNYAALLLCKYASVVAGTINSMRSIFHLSIIKWLKKFL